LLMSRSSIISTWSATKLTRRLLSMAFFCRTGR
jgi:hypothetical protein